MTAPVLSRRRLLAGGCAAVAAAALRTSFAPGAAFGQDGGHTLVTVFLRGGLDGLSAVVPWDDPRYHALRPTTRVPGAEQFDLQHGFGLHPALAPLHGLRDHLAVVHSAGQADATRSHFDAQAYVDSGLPGQAGGSSGWLARHVLATGASAAPLGVVAWGAAAPASLRGLPDPLALASLRDFGLAVDDDRLPAGMAALRGLYGADDLLGGRARATLGAMDRVADLRAGLDLDAPSAYPDTDLGRGLREVAWTIRADVGLTAATLDVGGWDTHDHQGDASGGRLTGLLADLGASLAAFADDLGTRMDRVTLVTMSEFGRRVAENGSRGTDHGRATTMFVLGGGVRGGVHGDWLGLEDDALVRGDVPVTTDVRSVLAEVLVDRAGGTDLAEVFPGFTPRPRGLVLRP